MRRLAVVLFVLFVTLCTALTPSSTGHSFDAVLIALGVVVPAILLTAVSVVATRSDVQPVALLSLHSFRAPPVRSLVG